MRTRIVSLILVVAICLSFFSVGLTQASAYSTGYPNTHQNTGNQVQDLIGVAKTQVGYTENNGTKYGAWVGNYRTAWCAAFLSWCANQAGIPESVIPPSSGVSGFVNIGAYHFATNISGYIPSAGDFMLFKPLANSNNNSYYTPSIVNGKYSSYSHVALVVSVDSANGTVTIIDGNWGHAVQHRTIKLSTYYIAAYVTPKYETGYDHSASDNNNIYYTEKIDAPTASQSLYPSGSDVKLTWPSLKGVTSYKVRIYNSDGERVLSKTVSENSITVSGLKNGAYTATVTASFSGLSSRESAGTEFFIQNISNGSGTKTVNDGIYIIKSLDNGYTLGITGNNDFILSRSTDISSVQKFNVTYVADGKYKVTPENSFNSGSFANYIDSTLYYIVEQDDGSYIFELAQTPGNVLSCGIDSVVASYCSTSISPYLGADTQKWYFCDAEGKKLSVKYTETPQYVTNMHPFIENGKLTLNISTVANPDIKSLRITITTNSEDVIVYADSYTQVGEEYIWSVSTSIPSQDAKIAVDYRLESSANYSENHFIKNLSAYDGVIHSTFNSISYTVDEQKLILKVSTPANAGVYSIRLSFADALGASIASTEEYSVKGDNHIWTIEMSAPTQDIDVIIDYQKSDSLSYAKDYYRIHLSSYESTLSQGIIKSVHQSIVGDELTFIIKTTKSIHSLHGIMATPVGELEEPIQTQSFIEASDSYIWTITTTAPTENTEYRFYPLLNDGYVISEDYTLSVFIPDAECAITNVTHTLVDDKLIFRVTTPCNDSITRVKLALANDCSSNIVTCSQPVKVGDSYVWELTINEPEYATAFCFDVRFAETSKYSKNYYYYTHTKSKFILDASFDTSSGSTICTVTTEAGAFRTLTLNVDGKDYSTDEFTIVNGKWVWVIDAGKASSSIYRFGLCDAITGASINDSYSLYLFN